LDWDLRLAALELAVAEVRDVVQQQPHLDVRGLLAELEARAVALRSLGQSSGADVIEEKCARCGRTILITERGYVTHVNAEGGLNRGCRAATFTSERGWDDSIPKTWKATRPTGPA
jgi:hypothetical protein